MRPSYCAVLAVLALAPALAGCAGSGAMAKLDLKDACVFSAPAEKKTLRDRMPTGEMTINHWSVPVQQAQATLIPPRDERDENCPSPHVG